MAYPSFSDELQWSHVLMDVDRPIVYFDIELDDMASMEPRPDGRG